MPHSAPLEEQKPVRISLLGRLRIERGSTSIQLPTRKVESLFAYLLLNPGRHARDKLATLFWGDSPETEARNSLRNALAILNKKLGHELLLSDRQVAGINHEAPLWVDVLELEQQAASFLDSPLLDAHPVDFELYQDDLLSNLYDDWIYPFREHYRSLFLDALLQITQQMRSRSEYERAVDFAHKALALDGANERAHQHLMFCYMAWGDRSAALRQYEACQQALWEQLAVEPAAATVALYEWIKQSPADARPFEAQITNLPIPLTSFIGRKPETAEVKSLLSSRRFLSLTGPGGSGKTRLAIQVAADLLDAFEDGVWWVELGPLADASLVPGTIAKALGAQEVAHQPIHETLASFLRAKQLLLILDNCEHLVRACAQISEYLLKTCPNIKILTTSRESLNIPGETVWFIPTLSLPDPQRLSLVDLLMEYEGIRLFLERAVAVNPGFALTVENASSVVQVCHRLDGVPLAIELAAARIKVLSPEQIAARLDDRFRLLTGGGRTALPRHQTLQAAIDWSYDLLTRQERALFRRLGVFAGGWTVESAEAVCAGEGIAAQEVIDLVANLVDKSLVIRKGVPTGEARFYMLETIREYAHEVLRKTHEEKQVQERYFYYYLGMVESIRPHLGFFLPDREMLSWMRVLSQEQDNLRAALFLCHGGHIPSPAGLRLAGKLHWFWLARGQLVEGREWLERLLADEPDAPKPVLAQAWLSAGFLACWQGDFVAARASLEKSLGLFEEIKESPGIVFSLAGLGFAANGLGDHVLAGALFEKSLALAREIHDTWLVSFALHFTAIGVSFRGDFEGARTLFAEHIRLAQEGIGNSQGTAFGHFHLGRIARLQGDFAGAYLHLVDGIRIFWQMGDRRGLGYSLAGFACLALAQQATGRAARLFGAVDAIRKELGSLLEAILQDEYEQAKGRTRELLGEDEFNAAWTDGESMPLERVVEYALAGEQNASKANPVG